MKHTTETIIDRLHEYYDARDTYKSLRSELAKLAVECGQDQKDAKEGNPVHYLDGWLAGQGCLPQARKSTGQGVPYNDANEPSRND